MRGPLEQLFLREKPVLAILAVGEMDNAYAAQVAKRIDATFPHTCRILSLLEEQGLLKSRPEGRINYLELTVRGKSVANALRELSDLLKKPAELEQKLERLRQTASATGGPDAALRLGPLRRDLAKLIRREDPLLREAAAELDAVIVAIVRDES